MHHFFILLMFCFSCSAFSEPGVDTKNFVVEVRASLPLAQPEYMESQVVKPLEDALVPLSHVVSVKSVSAIGEAKIEVRFKGQAGAAELDTVARAVRKAVPRLPPGISAPIVTLQESVLQ